MITFDDNEKHLLTIRKHWFVLLAQVIPLAVLGILPLFGSFFYFLLPAEGQEILRALLETRFSLLVAAYALWLLFLWAIAFFRITDYYLDAWYVTDKRIIDVEQKGFFSREVAAVTLDRIQDLKIEIHGIIGTYFDFGDIHAQTAGRMREFFIHGVYSPYDYKEKILNIMEGYRERQQNN